MATYAIGDIHGRIAALKQCLAKASFDKKHDMLIVLGDVADGGLHTKQCFDELLTIPNLIYVLGNHDAWALQWMKTGDILPIWWNQGGLWTAKSYDFMIKNVPKAHIKLLENAELYFVKDKMMFVHGGYDPKKSLELQEKEKEYMMWDRSIIDRAKNGAKFPGFKKVFIGHTTVQLMAYGTDTTGLDCKPLNFGKLWMLDTGAGWSGKLTIMDIHTEKYWQSDKQEPEELATGTVAKW